MGFNGKALNCWLAATHPGDAQYSRCNQHAWMCMPGKLQQGIAQAITFNKPANVMPGTKEITLAATASSGLPVEYYVVSGPAEVIGNKLRFTPIPPRTKMPVKVIVTAYQMGRTTAPLTQSAAPVERSFLIVASQEDLTLEPQEPAFVPPTHQQSSAGTPAPAAESPAQRDARMAWWREARFGMFVHWGLYSGLAGNWDGKSMGSKGGMEWIQNIAKADTATYAEAAIPKFQPVPGFAKVWAKLAKDAGCRYIVFTTKHHEGFALHDSKFGDYHAGKILHRDLVKEIVEAARAEGLKIGFYHSLIDWHFDQYDYTRAKGLPHPLAGKPSPNRPRVHSKYIDYLHAQVGELVSNYGPVDVIWWDFSSKGFQGDDAWRAADLTKLVRTKQPGIILNNRLYATATNKQPNFSTDHGDFTTPEQHIPATGMPGVDWETCMTLNNTWGYSENDPAWKSDETLIRNLIDIASKGGNYLLNIGPKGDGSIPPETVKSMTAIGDWLKTHGEAIYGTTASPFPTALPWGRVTQKQDRIYLMILDQPADNALFLPRLKTAVKKAYLLGDPRQESLPVTVSEAGVTISLPGGYPGAMPRVVAVQLAGKVELDHCALPIRPDDRGVLTLRADDAALTGDLKLESGHVGWWLNPADFVSWQAAPGKSLTYKVSVEYACPQHSEGSEYEVTVGSRKTFGKVKGTESWGEFTTAELDPVVLEKSDQVPVTMKVLRIPGRAVMNLRSITLTPVAH